MKRFLILLFAIAPAAFPQSVRTTLTYDGAAFADLDGGIRTGHTYLGALRLGLTAAGSVTSAHVEVLNTHGGNPGDFAGDAQGVSSLAAPNRWRIEEAWLQWNFVRAKLSVLAGRYDLNSEFYRLQSAGLFLNSSFGVGPEFSQSGRKGPSIYPNTTSAIRITYRPVTSVLTRVAAFDGLILGEVAYVSRPDREVPRDIRRRLGRLAGFPTYATKVSLGGWRSMNSSHSSGIYLLSDTAIYSKGARRVAAFAQLGVGDARANRFAGYAGTGITIGAPFAGREHDEAGFAIARGRTSGKFNMLDNTLKGETALEWTYLAALGSHLAIQPDVQYVIHPSAIRDRRNALVAILRFEISR